MPFLYACLGIIAIVKFAPHPGMMGCCPIPLKSESRRLMSNYPVASLKMCTSSSVPKKSAREGGKEIPDVYDIRFVFYLQHSLTPICVDRNSFRPNSTQPTICRLVTQAPGKGWARINDRGLTCGRFLTLSLGRGTFAYLSLKRFHGMREHSQYHLKAFTRSLGTAG